MNKKIKRVIGLVLILIFGFGVTFGVYVSNPYMAQTTSKTIQKEEATIIETEKWIAMDFKDSDVGIIFYPGAKVDHHAYIPFVYELSKQEGVSCFIVEMPFHFAFFGSNRAQEVMDAHPEIKTWYMMGHSLGGAFASSFASDHANEVKGLIVLGAYVYKDYPIDQSLTIYGSEDNVLDRTKITYTKNVHVIQGGNHCQFGDYGFQDGDGKASISAQKQWSETIQIIHSWMYNE